MPDPKRDQSAKDKLLVAATDLMSSGKDFSTREVLAAADVTAPTLYHHFGNKQGLIDAVARHGFAQYVPKTVPGEDPVDAIRDGWDQHVEFGLDHPHFYARLYGNIEPGTPCAVTGPAVDMMLLILEPAAAAGRLTVDPRKVAGRILAANVGVTLSLIGQPEDQRDVELSHAVREAILGSVFLEKDSTPEPDRSLAAQAVALATSIRATDNSLSEGERAMLGELLDRVAESKPSVIASS